MKGKKSMGCLLPIIAIFMPRVSLFFIWVFTNWLSHAYETRIWPFLGFLFMPFTTLAYMAAMINNNHHVSGGWLVLLVVAVLFDLGGQGGSGGSSSNRGESV